MSKSKHPAPIYRKPEMVPATAENVQAVMKALADPAADRLARMLEEEGDALRVYLASQGVSVTKRPPADRLRPGHSYVTVDGGFVTYRKADVHPAVIEAVEALAAVGRVRESDGARQVLEAFNLGAALERTRATAAFARAVHTGQAVRSGGKAGAARAHGPRSEREAERTRWRERFAEVRRKFPEAPKKVLLGIIADETGETFRTLRRYIKQR